MYEFSVVNHGVKITKNEGLWPSTPFKNEIYKEVIIYNLKSVENFYRNRQLAFLKSSTIRDA